MVLNIKTLGKMVVGNNVPHHTENSSYKFGAPVPTDLP